MVRAVSKWCRRGLEWGLAHEGVCGQCEPTGSASTVPQALGSVWGLGSLVQSVVRVGYVVGVAMVWTVPVARCRVVVAAYWACWMRVGAAVWGR